MVTIQHFLRFSLLFALIYAKSAFKIRHYDELAWGACESFISNQATYFARKDKAGFCNVRNQPALGTMTHCIRQLPRLQQAAEDSFLLECAKYDLTSQQFQAAYDNATAYMISKPSKNDPNFDKSVAYNKPIEFTNEQINDAFVAQLGRFINYNYAVWYGVALISYWFLLIFLSGIARGANFLFPRFFNTLTNPLINMVRKYIFLPALFNKSHVHPRSLGKYVFWELPTRWEFIMVFVWVVLAIIFNIVDINHDENNFIWSVQSMEIGRKIGDRSGIMVLFLIPPLILFAGRNNFLQWVSGWNYSRFVYVHKWVAKIAVILVIVHAIGFTYNYGGFHAAKYRAVNARPYIVWGYVSMVSGCILIFQATYSIKRLNYEVFLILHQLFAVFFIVGGWIHCEKVGYQYWFYASVAIWCFDRFVRIIRLISFGIRPATVQLLANETVKVVVARPKHWKTVPGCHAFIHFIRPTCFWQSHPFTLVDEVEDDGTNTISLYLKVKGGVTHGLYKYLANQPENKATIKVSIEGPYGHRLPIDRYDTAVFLTGGNGIPGLYYEARDLAAKDNKTRVRFYWVIRHYASIEWFYPELLKLAKTNIEPIIYVTQPHLGMIGPIVSETTYEVDGEEEKSENFQENESKETKETESLDYAGLLKSKLAFIEFREGRPDIQDLVRQEILESNGAIAFATCAHTTMVDDARKTIAESLDLSDKRVELFEEIQGW